MNAGMSTQSDDAPQAADLFITSTNINVNILGYFLDGWADLIEGMADKVQEVRQKVVSDLKDRDMPEVDTREMVAYVSITSNERRPYTINTTNPGATTTIYIDKHGRDLYVAWRTFIQPVLNNQVILTALGISGFLGLVTGGIDSSRNFYGRSEVSFSLFGWIVWTIGFMILACLGIAAVGRILKNNYLAFFFIEPSVFDAEDITAMSLSAHKSLLRALDSTGIDITKLRLKQTFKGGRRGEDL